MWSTDGEIGVSRPGCQFLVAIAQSALRIWLLVSRNCGMCLPILRGPCLLFATTSGLRGTCPLRANSSSLRGTCPLFATPSGLRSKCPLLANSSNLRGNCPLLANSSRLRGSRAHDSSISTEMMELSDCAIARPTCNATSCLLHVATFYLWALLARSGQHPRRDLGRSHC